MSRTVRQCIVTALENLTRDQLQCFKEDLSEVNLRPDFDPIPRGKLEAADAQGLGRLLVNTYREEYAAQLTRTVLEGMSERAVADSLVRSLSRVAGGTGTAGGATVGAGVTGTAGAATVGAGVTGTDAPHPIDRFFLQIVQQFHSTEEVLDALMAAGVLTAEHYDRLRAKATTQEKNRELLVIVRGRGPGAKDQLWDAMKKADPYFVGSLTSS